MSDGGRERASLEVEVCKSSQKWSVQRLAIHALGVIVQLMHYVYVLRLLKDSGFYIGYSAYLRKRFSEHVTGGSFAASSRSPWQLT
jgi:hypothetical protein